MRKALGKIKDRKDAAKQRRRLAIRKKVVGTAERPRICVAKTNKNLLVQVINDTDSKTILSVASFGKKAPEGASNTKDGAKVLGAKVAEGLKGQNVSVAVFDRAGNQYHGVIASLVESIRENGIQI